MKEWRDNFRMLNCENIRPDGWPGESFTVLWLRPSKVEQFLGWKPHRAWKPERDNIIHKIQVSRVRAALCGLDADRWVPERKLWRDAMLADRVRPPIHFNQIRSMIGGRLVTTNRPRPTHRPVHDGRCKIGDRWWAVEVELTLKKPVSRLTTPYWPRGTRGRTRTGTGCSTSTAPNESATPSTASSMT